MSFRGKCNKTEKLWEREESRMSPRFGLSSCVNMASLTEAGNITRGLIQDAGGLRVLF